MGRAGVAVVVACSLAASSALADNLVRGFMVGPGVEIIGTVTASDGHPLAGVLVHVASSVGPERIVKTGADGSYRVTTPARGDSVVFIRGDGRITGSSTVIQGEAEGEAFVVEEVLPPAVPAVPRTSPYVVPDYSEAAMDRDQWTKAWLLLAVDATGRVMRLKLLRRPGFDLDDLALREAWTLRFEPARDRSNKPVATQVMWAIEWPAYLWLVRHNGNVHRIPPDAAGVPCAGTGPTHSIYRDCSQPDITAAIKLPWIERPKPR